MEDQLKKLLEKAENMETRNVEELQKELIQKLQEIRDQGLLPRGYAKQVNEQLGIKDRNRVYHVISGKDKFNLEIVEAVINLASQPKPEVELIEKANRLLKS